MTLTTGYLNRAKVIKWGDGDTVTLEVDTWPTQTSTVHVRLEGLDTPERGKPGAAEAVAWCKLLAPAGTVLMLSAGPKPLDKYGRILAVLTTADGICINVTLLAENLAKPYQGGSKTGLWP